MTIKKTYSTCGMTYEKKEDAIRRQAREEFKKDLDKLIDKDINPTNINKFSYDYGADIFQLAISAYLRNKEIYKDL